MIVALSRVLISFFMLLMATAQLIVSFPFRIVLSFTFWVLTGHWYWDIGKAPELESYIKKD